MIFLQNVKKKLLKLSKSESKTLLITLICTILGVFVPKAILNVIAVLNVLTVGIIHGANDLYLVTKSIKTSKKITFNLIFFIYVAFILFMVFALYHNPIIALMFFVLISSFHFGEQQWYNKSMISSNSDNIFYFFYGVLLFSILFISNFNETQSIINEISSVIIAKELLYYVLIISSIVLIFLIFRKINSYKNQLLFQTLSLILISLLFVTNDLFWSFSVYFVLWHSLPSLNEQSHELFPKEKNKTYKYLKFALPYWLLAIFGLVVSYFYIEKTGLSIISTFFAFLASITIPHVFVIFLMHNKKNLN